MHAHPIRVRLGEREQLYHSVGVHSPWLSGAQGLRRVGPVDALVDGAVRARQQTQAAGRRPEDAALRRRLDVRHRVTSSVHLLPPHRSLFKALAQTAARRSAFVESAVAFVRAHNFDGLDIDWEYPDAEDYANYVSLMTELRARFDIEAQVHATLLIDSIAGDGQGAPAPLRRSVGVGGEDRRRLQHRRARSVCVACVCSVECRVLDLLFLMAYDFHGGWESFTGANAPLYSRAGETGWLKSWNVVGACIARRSPTHNAGRRCAGLAGGRHEQVKDHYRRGHVRPWLDSG